MSEKTSESVSRSMSLEPEFEARLKMIIDSIGWKAQKHPDRSLFGLDNEDGEPVGFLNIVNDIVTFFDFIYPQQLVGADLNFVANDVNKNTRYIKACAEYDESIRITFSPIITDDKSAVMAFAVWKFEYKKMKRYLPKRGVKNNES
jgi:hypothetical protein